MTSKHDLMTLVITLAVIAAAVVLQVTHTLTGTLASAFTGLLVALGAFWFTRGGTLMNSNNPSPQSIVKETLNQVAKQPAGTANANTTNTQSKK